MTLTRIRTAVEMLTIMKSGKGVLWIDYDNRVAAFNENKGGADTVPYNEAIIARADPAIDILWFKPREAYNRDGYSNAQEVLGLPDPAASGLE
jgi:hypothetical protein